ncbi:hypothetical protein JW906_11915 [bacterium]|nr:hypothetical protein [bacterium]
MSFSSQINNSHLLAAGRFKKVTLSGAWCLLLPGCVRIIRRTPYLWN